MLPRRWCECRVFPPLNSVFIFLFNFLTGQEFYRVFFFFIVVLYSIYGIANSTVFTNCVFVIYQLERIDDTFYYLRQQIYTCTTLYMHYVAIIDIFFGVASVDRRGRVISRLPIGGLEFKDR